MNTYLALIRDVFNIDAMLFAHRLGKIIGMDASPDPQELAELNSHIAIVCDYQQPSQTDIYPLGGEFPLGGNSPDDYDREELDNKKEKKEEKICDSKIKTSVKPDEAPEFNKKNFINAKISSGKTGELRQDMEEEIAKNTEKLEKALRKEDMKAAEKIAGKLAKSQCVMDLIDQAERMATEISPTSIAPQFRYDSFVLPSRG